MESTVANRSQRVKQLARRQLDRRLDRLRRVSSLAQRPRGGWIAALRNALGMSQEELARRMGVSRQAVGQLERREAEGTATLQAVEQAARALGGELMYAIVPARSITETLKRRADRLAHRLTASVRHTMRLEDQAPDRPLDERAKEIARVLLDKPSRLWSITDDE